LSNFGAALSLHTAHGWIGGVADEGGCIATVVMAVIVESVGVAEMLGVVGRGVDGGHSHRYVHCVGNHYGYHLNIAGVDDSEDCGLNLLVQYHLHLRMTAVGGNAVSTSHGGMSYDS